MISGETAMALSIESPAFQYGNKIPAKYTCDGENISPPLNWKGIPKNTQSLVMIMDDPDAPGGTWDHWILFNLPPDLTNLPENIKNLPSGTFIGTNSWHKTNYGGPCPPAKQVHRYYFKLYALDTILNLNNGAKKTELVDAMKNHILASDGWMGKYARQY